MGCSQSTPKELHIVVGEDGKNRKVNRKLRGEASQDMVRELFSCPPESPEFAARGDTDPLVFLVV